MSEGISAPFIRYPIGTSLMMAGERNCDEVKRGMAYLHNPIRDTFGHGVFDIEYRSHRDGTDLARAYRLRRHSAGAAVK